MRRNEPTPILVVGAGAWGTALAAVLLGNGHRVKLWGRDAAHREALRTQGRNERYLPGAALTGALEVVDDLAEAASECADVIIAVPCAALPEVLDAIAASHREQHKLCLACKGLQAPPRALNHELITGRAGNRDEVAALSGPSFAVEVAAGLPTAVTIAGARLTTADHFAAIFHNRFFRAYTHDDLIGVQLGGAVKNIIAIAAGVANGLRLGANTHAALLTRGLAEMIRLGDAMGGRRETFMGLAGLGDLALTCGGAQSRNFHFGQVLAGGATVEQARDTVGKVIEGIGATRQALSLARKHNVEMPITEQVDKILRGESGPRDAVQQLLTRGQRREID